MVHRMFSLASRSLWAACCIMLAVTLAGCDSASNSASTPPQPQPADHAAHDDVAERKASLAKLSDEDRALAESQEYCPVSSEPLGSMGPPLKLMINGEAMFICCKGCEGTAKSKPDEMLAKLAELKAKAQTEKTQ